MRNDSEVQKLCWYYSDVFEHIPHLREKVKKYFYFERSNYIDAILKYFCIQTNLNISKQ